MIAVAADARDVAHAVRRQAQLCAVNGTFAGRLRVLLAAAIDMPIAIEAGEDVGAIARTPGNGVMHTFFLTLLRALPAAAGLSRFRDTRPFRLRARWRHWRAVEHRQSLSSRSSEMKTR
jgi:hypothetical protein